MRGILKGTLLLAFSACFLIGTAAAKVTMKLELAAEGLVHPLVLISPPDGSKRRFIVEQRGTILILMPDGTLLPKPFLDIGGKMVKLRKDFDERGLLGLAFHPNYKSNGKFYVYYSAPMRNDSDNFRAMLYWNHTTHVSEFRVSKDNPNLANGASERILMQVDEPQFNHNGGALAFGPDGYLYISLGDGGFADDKAIGHSKQGNGQDRSNLLGSILRIDVNSGSPYGIPRDNPFVGQKKVRPEIYAYGFRNPWRMSFDRGGKHALYVADVGQNSFESVDRVVKGGNHGWPVMEGTHCFNMDDPNNHKPSCANGGMIPPIIEYGNTKTQKVGKGRSITGGFIYRGSKVKSLRGAYVFGDWSKQFLQHDGAILVARPSSGGGMWKIEDVDVEGTQFNAYVLAFGEDGDGEVYVLTTNNTAPTRANDKIYKIVGAY